MAALDDTFEELFSRYETLGFQQVVTSEQIVEGSKLFGCLYLFCNDAPLVGFINARLHTLADALFGRMAVQRVVYTHPVDRKELLLAELAVSEHLMAEITHLYIYNTRCQSLAQRTKHLSEKHLAVDIVSVYAFTQQTAVHEEIGWQPRRAVAYDGQHVSHHLTIRILGYNHVWLLPRRLPRQAKELSTVEEIPVIQCRKLFLLGYNIDQNSVLLL